VVSRDGRPDLVRARLAAVTAPTLLIVGGDDEVVLDLNRRAQAELRCEMGDRQGQELGWAIIDEAYQMRSDMLLPNAHSAAPGCASYRSLTSSPRSPPSPGTPPPSRRWPGASSRSPPTAAPCRPGQHHDHGAAHAPILT
jgi:hypothetical protein